MTNNWQQSARVLPNLERESKISLTYRRQSSANDPILGSVAVLTSPDSLDRILAIEKVFFDHVETEAEIERVVAQLSLRHKNLVNLLDYAVSVTRTSKSIVFCVRKFYEFPGTSLQTIWDEVRNSKVPRTTLHSDQLQQLIKDVSDALLYLSTKGLAHGSISPGSVFSSSAGSCFKLVFLGTSPEMANQNHLEAMLKGQTIFVSPQIAAAFQSNRSFGIQHDREKSDIFSLGMVFLRLALHGHSFQVYDKKGRLLSKEYKKALQSLGSMLKLYPELLALVKRMLELKEENRPTLLELSKQIGCFLPNLPDGTNASVFANQGSKVSAKSFDRSPNWESGGQSSLPKDGSCFQKDRLNSNPFFSNLTEDENLSSQLVHADHYEPRVLSDLGITFACEPVRNSNNYQSSFNNHIQKIRPGVAIAKPTSEAMIYTAQVFDYKSTRPSSPNHFDYQDQATHGKSTLISKNMILQMTNTVVDCKDGFFEETIRTQKNFPHDIVAPVSTPIGPRVVSSPLRGFQVTPSRFGLSNASPCSRDSTPSKVIGSQAIQERAISQLDNELSRYQNSSFKTEITRLPYRRISISNSPITIHGHLFVQIETHSETV